MGGKGPGSCPCHRSGQAQGPSPWIPRRGRRGGLLLELYTRDGIGTMISRDFYEGCRPARADDLEAIAFLLDPLMKAGVLAPRCVRAGGRGV